MDPPPTSSPTAEEHRARVFARLEDAGRTFVASLGELLAEGLVTPAEIIDAIGFEELERHLSPAQRSRLLAAAVRAGRRGAPFDDVAFLNVVAPDALASALPLDLLSGVIAALRQGESSMEQLDDADLAPLSMAHTGFSSEPPRHPEEVSPESVELLPPSMPGPFDDSPTKS